MNTRRCFPRTAGRLAPAAALSALLGFSGPGRADFITTFDAGLDGWTATGGALVFEATEGNPGGYLRQDDTVGDYMAVFAPAGARGDQSALLGGTVSFDARNLNGVAADLSSEPAFGTITISGPGGSASLVLGGLGEPPPDRAWHTYSAALDPALWAGDLAAALADVAEVRVVLESNSQIVESNGFDNFALRAGRPAAVPEPAGVALLMAGGLGLLGYARRRGHGTANVTAAQ